MLMIAIKYISIFLRILGSILVAFVICIHGNSAFVATTTAALFVRPRCAIENRERRVNFRIEHANDN
jgi:hypothetical protein